MLKTHVCGCIVKFYRSKGAATARRKRRGFEREYTRAVVELEYTRAVARLRVTKFKFTHVFKI